MTTDTCMNSFVAGQICKLIVSVWLIVLQIHICSIHLWYFQDLFVATLNKIDVGLSQLHNTMELTDCYTTLDVLY